MKVGELKLSSSPRMARGCFIVDETKGAPEATEANRVPVSVVRTNALRFRPSSQRAFSLPEVLVGVFVLAIIVVALYSAFAHGTFMTQMAREDLRATQILIEKSEALRLSSWQQISNLPPSFTALYDPRVTNSGLVFTGAITMVNVPGYSSLKEARIRVNWKTGKVAHQRELKTYVARYGLQTYVD